MKIAMVTAVPPLPTTEGMRHRAAGVATALATLGDIEIHVVSSAAFTAEDLHTSRQVFASVRSYRTERDMPEGVGAKLRRAMDIKWVAGRSPQVRQEERGDLLTRLESADVVWIHTLQLADSVGVFHWDHSVLDFDDLVSEKSRLHAATMPTVKGRVHKQLGARTWRRWEIQAAKRFSAFSVCSQADSILLRPYLQADVVPNAIDPATPEPPMCSGTEEPILGFTGLIKHFPNSQGLAWFIKYVLPQIRAVIPHTRLRVVGRLPEQHDELRGDGVDLLGFVPDPTAEVATWSASVVPLLVGGGTRLKIIGSIRAGCPVVSTSVGAFGLAVKHDESILIGDDPASFAEQCIRLLKSPELGRRLIEEGRRIVRANYLWPSMQAGVAAAVQRAVNSSASKGAHAVRQVAEPVMDAGQI